MGFQTVTEIPTILRFYKFYEGVEGKNINNETVTCNELLFFYTQFLSIAFIILKKNKNMVISKYYDR